jgi:hypothetical protein
LPLQVRCEVGVRRFAAGAVRRTGAEGGVKEPSWRTAVSEAESARRHLAQASESLERLSREVAALRERGESQALLVVARRLASGSDGGVLTALVVASADSSASPELRASVEALLARLTEALGVSPLACRGEWLQLLPEELAEFDVRGLPREPPPGRSLYCVVRPGWALGPLVLDRPLLEPGAVPPGD